MIFRSPIALLLAAFAAIVFPACSSSPLSRIDANRTKYESWPLEIQEAVLNGRATAGMTPEMVRVALGEPTRIDTRGGASSGDEIWVYQKGSGPGLPLPNVSVGGGIGGVGVSTGSRRGGGSRRPANADEQQVVFQNGVVTRVD